MFLLYFLDTYINLVKYLQNVSLDVYINWCYLHQDAGNIKYEVIVKVFKSNHLQAYEKEYWRLSS